MLGAAPYISRMLGAVYFAIKIPLTGKTRSKMAVARIVSNDPSLTEFNTGNFSSRSSALLITSANDINTFRGGMVWQKKAKRMELI